MSEDEEKRRMDEWWKDESRIDRKYIKYRQNWNFFHLSCLRFLSLHDILGFYLLWFPLLFYPWFLLIWNFKFRLINLVSWQEKKIAEKEKKERKPEINLVNQILVHLLVLVVVVCCRLYPISVDKQFVEQWLKQSAPVQSEIISSTSSS